MARVARPVAIALGSSQLHAGLPPTIKATTAPKVTIAAPRVVVPPKVTVVKAPVVKVPVVKAPVVPKVVAAPRVPAAVTAPRLQAIKAPVAPKPAPKAFDPTAGLAAAQKLGKKSSGTSKPLTQPKIQPSSIGGRPIDGLGTGGGSLIERGTEPLPTAQGARDPRIGMAAAKKLANGSTKPQRESEATTPKEPKKPSEKPAKGETKKPDPKAEDTPQTQEEYEAWKAQRAKEERARREAEREAAERRQKEEANS